MREQAPIKNFLRAGVVALAVGAGACDQGPAITEGQVYKKEHTIQTLAVFPLLRGASNEINLDVERWTIESPEPIYLTGGTPKELLLKLAPPKSIIRTESYDVFIAQCPFPTNDPPRTIQKIEAECKIATFSVSGDVFPNFRPGQYADFKPQK